MKYSTKITGIGSIATNLNANNVIILNDENTTDELMGFTFLHPLDELKEEVKSGDILKIDGKEYEIVRIGNFVNRNLKENGHVVLELENNDPVESLSLILLKGGQFPLLKEGSTIEIM